MFLPKWKKQTKHLETSWEPNILIQRLKFFYSLQKKKKAFLPQIAKNAV
jgi:hypothetical protein